MRPHVGIQAKLFLVISALAFVLTLALTAFGWRWHEVAATEALERKALTYGQLVGRSVESAIAFDDRVTASEEFSAVGVDPDVTALALFRADGTLIEGRGAFGDLAPAAVTAQPTLARSSRDVRSQTLVRAREGRTGVLVVVVSKSALQQQLHDLRNAVVCLAMGMMSGGLVIAWWLSRSLARRIGRIATAASEVAAGVLHRSPLEDPSSDEVGQLAGAFNAMVAELQRLVRHVEDTAAEQHGRLERLVGARTTELAERNGAMRVLLDNIGEGFLMLDAAGRIGAERSKAVDHWFGAPEPGVLFWQHFAALNPAFSDWFALSWESLADGSLPASVVVDQFPKRLQIAEKSFEVAVCPILEGENVSRVLVDIRDITHHLEREQSESLQREVLELLERALDDRSAYVSFMSETGAIAQRMAHQASGELVDVARDLHTLKGNCGLFGLTSIATFCHDIETRMAISGGLPSFADRSEVAKRWLAATARLSNIFSKKATAVSVERAELEALIALARGGAPREQIVRGARMLCLDPLDGRLRHLAVQAASLAERLDKPLTAKVTAPEIRFDAETWGPFMASLAHVVRNSLDHGIESAEGRCLAGKSAVGSFSIDARVDERRFTIEIGDDGAGIDWVRLAARAHENGLPCATHGELTAALFADGLSTKETIDEVSGRGVGLGAVRQQCATLGGVVTVDSELGRGTTFRFVFPRAALGDAYDDETLSRPKAA